MMAASVSVLLVEAVIGFLANYVWEQAQEAPPLPYNALGLALLVIGAPFVAAVGGLLCAFLTVGVVMPILTAAAWLGRRLSGREAWWWVPVVSAAAAVPAVTASLALLADAGVLASLIGGVTVAVGLTAPALVARRLLLPDRPRLSGRTMVGRVALYGALAAVTAFALAGVALNAGVAYEPPWFNAGQVAGTYSDGKGGTLTLTPDGAAVATRIDTFDYAVDSFDPLVRACTGAGTWSYDPAQGPYSQQVDVSIDACPVATDSWSLYGTHESPKLFTFIGDPDSWELYTLRRD
ncbi:hypothetical protein GTW71_37845 [Streptomyces sp. SID6041]|nr:hypothetical protein [Streptomyces sp. SID6041]